ncbi:hypothetical protein DY000_02036020 [Brassica cretica]|uniref:Enolpyruvate transferase domain-containing protein n=1 Tax=Brassica cretica TaxID=69181 RepID=A0ABQ7E0D7_BRACR|nr:hypothetical protein DY000_02036020 [Brassica cretica]
MDQRDYEERLVLVSGDKGYYGHMENLRRKGMNIVFITPGVPDIDLCADLTGCDSTNCSLICHGLQNPCVISNLSKSNQNRSPFSVSLQPRASSWGLKKSGTMLNGSVIRPVKVTASVSTAEKASEIVLQPIREISGLIKLPGSKSLSNRILLLAALSEGTTVVDNLLNSDDINYMLDALKKLGLNVERDSVNNRAVVEGCGGIFPASLDSKSDIELYLGNAGTAMRPLTAAVTAAGGNAR